MAHTPMALMKKSLFMKKKINLWFLVLGALLVVLGTNSKDPDMIYWSEDYRLSWDDFEGIPAYHRTSVSALTASGIVHYKGCKDGKIIYKVRSYFEKNESWVKDEARTPHHLAHEQIHFDITELYARQLRKALLKKSFNCGQEADFEQFVKPFIQAWQAEQKAYDQTSRHSLAKSVQKEWFYKIAAELEQLEQYKE